MSEGKLNFWMRVSENVIGVLAGAAVTLAAMTYQSHVKQEVELQEWFEEEYLQKGIGELDLATATLLTYAEFNQKSAEVLANEQGGNALQFPQTSFQKLRDVLGNKASSDLRYIFTRLYSWGSDLEVEDNMVAFEGVATGLQGILSKLERLLRVQAEKLSSRSGVYDLIRERTAQGDLVPNPEAAKILEFLTDMRKKI